MPARLNSWDFEESVLRVELLGGVVLAACGTWYTAALSIQAWSLPTAQSRVSTRACVHDLANHLGEKVQKKTPPPGTPLHRQRAIPSADCAALSSWARLASLLSARAR